MDVRCVVCGEPWDYLGINGGDMLKWEAKLFHEGAGCPCCEGETDKPFEPESIEDIEYGDLDPAIRLNQIEAVREGKKPEWKRPEDKVNWTCAGCGVQSITNADNDEIEWYKPPTAKVANWYVSHNESMLGDPTEPAHTFTKDQPVCDACLDSCYECGCEVSSMLELGDPYDDGWCGDYEGDLYCVDCLPSGEDEEE